MSSQLSDVNVDPRTGAGGIGAPSDQFLGYVRDQVVHRRRHAGRDDALDRMVSFRRRNGTGFDDDELTHHVRTLLTAGNETTTSLMANLMYRLLTTAAAVDRLRANHDLIPAAVEESLRLDAPVQVLIGGYGHRPFCRHCPRSR